MKDLLKQIKEVKYKKTTDKFVNSHEIDRWRYFIMTPLKNNAKLHKQ